MQTGSGPFASRLPTVVTAIAVVLAVIGLGVAVSGAADKPADKLASNDASTTTTTAVTTTVVADATTTTAARGSVTTTKSTGTTAKSTTATTLAAACAAPPAASADPGAQQAPAIGTYTYASCSDSSDTSEMKVAAGTGGNGTARRVVSENTSGFAQTSTYAYGPSGVLLESLTVSTPQGPYTCDWDPDVVNYPPSLKVGTTWTAKSSCQLKNSKGVSQGELKLDGTGKVSGKVQFAVGGTSVNAWVVEATIKLTTVVTGFGTQTATVTSKDYYDPTRGIDLYRHYEGTSEQGGSVTRDERLTSLTPKANA